MGMTIDELITFCEEEEYTHRLRCKQYDVASGYTRSKVKNIRTSDAIREENYADSYKEISEILRNYKKLQRALDEIRAEIIKYEGDCRLSVDEYPSCKQCTDNVFESIYEIIDKWKTESEK